MRNPFRRSEEDKAQLEFEQRVAARARERELAQDQAREEARVAREQARQDMIRDRNKAETEAWELQQGWAAQARESAARRSEAAAAKRAAREAAEEEAEKAKAVERLQRKAEREAEEARIKAAWEKLGHSGHEPNFECSECGRWAEVGAAASAYRPLAEKTGLTFKRWLAVAGMAGVGVRAAFLQREFGMSYEAATDALDSALRYGLLEKGKDGRLVRTKPRCDVCYGRSLERGGEPLEDLAPPARDGVPAQLRFRVLQRDGFRCQYCGRSARDGAVLHLDHVVPASAGGETSEGNLITACDQCNLGKSATRIVGT